MNILPNGKSDLFQSELQDFKDRFVSNYIKEALGDIEEVNAKSKPERLDSVKKTKGIWKDIPSSEIESDEATRSFHTYPDTNLVKDPVEISKRHLKGKEAACLHGHEASTCAGDCENVVEKKVTVIKKKKNKPLHDVVKEGDEVESTAKRDLRYISLAELKTTISRMNKVDKDKLISYWSEILGESWAKALVKEYF